MREWRVGEYVTPFCITQYLPGMFAVLAVWFIYVAYTYNVYSVMWLHFVCSLLLSDSTCSEMQLYALSLK